MADDKDPDYYERWRHARSLEDRIIHLFEEKLTDSEEFKTYCRIYGREKMVRIYKKYQQRKKEKFHG